MDVLLVLAVMEVTRENVHMLTPDALSARELGMWLVRVKSQAVILTISKKKGKVVVMVEVKVVTKASLIKVGLIGWMKKS